MTGIQKISQYQGQDCCSRCGTGIKNITKIEFIDGTSEVFGSECINKILSKDISAKKICNKTFKKLAEYQLMVDIFKNSLETAPYIKPVNDRGLYPISSKSTGVWFTFDGQLFYHPYIMDMNKVNSGTYKYNEQELREKFLLHITQAIPKIEMQINKMTKFLAKYFTN